MINNNHVPCVFVFIIIIIVIMSCGVIKTCCGEQEQSEKRNPRDMSASGLFLSFMSRVII